MLFAIVVFSFLLFLPTIQSFPTNQMYSGGIPGFGLLSNPANSQRYRSLGGNLYLHWFAIDQLTNRQLRNILRNFRLSKKAIELGYQVDSNSGTIVQWAIKLQGYVQRGIKPDIVYMNCFANSNVPTLDEWAGAIRTMRQYTGLPNLKVIPTFEYANFYMLHPRGLPNQDPTRTFQFASQNKLFQQLIAVSGGLQLDVPATFFLINPQVYREWVFDAVRVAANNGYEVHWIASPYLTNDTKYLQNTKIVLQQIKTFTNHVPNIIDFEDYNEKDVLKVGPESNASSVLGVSLAMSD